MAIALLYAFLHCTNLPFRIPNTIGYTVMGVSAVENNILEGLYGTLYNLLFRVVLRSLHVHKYLCILAS